MQRIKLYEKLSKIIFSTIETLKPILRPIKGLIKNENLNSKLYGYIWLSWDSSVLDYITLLDADMDSQMLVLDKRSDDLYY